MLWALHSSEKRGTIVCGLTGRENVDHGVVLNHIGVQELVLVSTLSSDVKSLVNKHFETSWERALKHFVPRPADLRAMMRSCSAVISGSLALWFVTGCPKSWFPNDCDFYVPVDRAKEMARYLRLEAGYEADGSRRDFNREEEEYVNDDDPRANPSIESVAHFLNGAGKRVDIIESTEDSALLPIPRFWCTFLSNYVAADTFCVAYPFLTMRQKGCLCLAEGAPIPPVHRAMEKYKDRGFHIGDFTKNIDSVIAQTYPRIASDGCKYNPYCPHTFRYFGDEWCLQYCFDERIGEYDVNAKTAQWRYGGTECGVCGHSSSFEVEVIDRSLL